MNTKILSQLFIGAVLLFFLSLGFYKAGIDDGPNVISYINSGGEIQMSVPNTQQFSSDMPGTWSLGANIPSPGSYEGAGVSYTRNDTTFIYCLNGDVDGSGTAPGQFRRYNVRTNVWDTLPRCPSGRCWISGARLGTNIYFVGGLPSGAIGFSQMTGTLQRYSITTNTWDTMIPAPTPTGAAGVAGYLDNYLYVIGGIGAQNLPITNVQIYDQNSGSWIIPNPLPSARANGWV